VNPREDQHLLGLLRQRNTYHVPYLLLLLLLLLLGIHYCRTHLWA
jgi:hypothetical protein